MIVRREFVAVMGAVSITAAIPGCVKHTGDTILYGLIGKMNVVPGKRDALIDILIEGLGSMPGCLSYIVAKDPENTDAIWVTEVWESKSSHEASLSLESVREAISRGKPLIAGFGERFETEPVGGHGLASQAA